jgi:multiple sugar transport system ATP-binding protein
MGDRIAVMNTGLLQQVGPPQELYEHPINKFVAGFIGSPAMNFLNLAIQRDNGTLYMRDDNVSLPVPDRLRPAVDASGGALTAGIRPEHFEVGTRADGAVSLTAKVDVVEFLGNEELLHVRVGEHDVVAIIGAAHRVRPGDDIELHVPVEKIHLFDQEEGSSLRAVVGV